MDRIRVVIADDHTMVREGIRALLAREGDIEILAEAADGAQALQVVEKLKPDLLLLDPALLRGPKPLQTVRAKSPRTQILILTEAPPGEESLDYIRAGAKGVISKGDTGDTLAKALRVIAAGEIWVRRKLMAQVLEELSALAHRVERPERTPVSRLTPREQKIGELVAQGYNNREIADTLRLSEKTVKNHLTNIFQRLRCRNRAQLTAMLLR